MDESLQQLVALIFVAAAVGFELRRRWIKRKKGKVGCEDCGPDKSSQNAKEAPVRFYKRGE
jgi:hypothetical protein